MTDVKSLNDTLEEQLRKMLVDKNNECQALKEEVKQLKMMVAEEQEGKYRAYVKFADLQKQFKQIKQKQNFILLNPFLYIFFLYQTLVKNVIV